MGSTQCKGELKGLGNGKGSDAEIEQLKKAFIVCRFLILLLD